MRRPQFIARQSRRPTGVLGSLLARIMARETAAENNKALELLHLNPTDYVLEIGFGHGRTLAKAAVVASKGLVAGVDISGTMVHMAARYNSVLLAAGRLEINRSDGETLSYPDCHFDKAYSVHTVYFWPRPQQVLMEIHRVLKRGGMLLLGFTSDLDKSRADFPANIYKHYSCAELQHIVEGAGFSDTRFVEHNSSNRRIVFLSARRP
jgi:ubiquinone/menaquinone biosynthesis C-methylase UbiE